jgi:hypothetical protein
MKMKTKLLAAAATLVLATTSAFAASTIDAAGAPPAASQNSTEFFQSDESVGVPVYQSDMPAYPGGTRHVIGGQTFYYGPGMSGGGGDGAQ